ncbi:hypothetical protein AVEN_50652-1 [Araneus ventricosus]|uniref:DUF5641 domain-containing protein n=1 Tax=Araneus ventricosus TaxID=182803 RepID=A0A4Y2ARH2_ARAVE|nr:hypothetical protein AVEN_50652-1 [Araneus ventricosus]
MTKSEEAAKAKFSFCVKEIKRYNDKWQKIIENDINVQLLFKTKSECLSLESDLQANYLLSAVPDGSLYEIYTENKDIISDFLVKIEEILIVKTKKNVSTNNSSRNSENKNNLKLPKLELPVFSGDLSAWLSFKEIFINTTHKNYELSETAKLSCLISSLKGDPEKLISATLTFLCQIEACINSRPLTPLSSDPSDISALTLGHFLIGSSLLDLPEPTNAQPKLLLSVRWQTIQDQRKQFWSRWSREYLHHLQHRPKWASPKRDLQIDDLVLGQDPVSSPLHWILGRIVKTFPGQDARARVAAVGTRDGEITRSISKISLILPGREDVQFPQEKSPQKPPPP